MIRLAELEGPDKNLLLMFLRELERRKMIWSKLDLSEDGKRTERIWYGYHSSEQTPKGLNQTEPIIRKVKVLRGRARDEADRMGFEPDDLVIVTASLHPLPEYHIEKIEGDPVSFLLKQIEGKENESRD